MKLLTNKHAGFAATVGTAGFAATVGTASSLPFPIVASTIDIETLELVLDDDFMARFREGVAQMERGDLRSFEDVFGEPL